ncbi:MAG: cation:proton antiporter [Ilumatobacteraceae bacterium]
MSLSVTAAFATSIVLYGLVSARLTRWNVTAPMVFLVLGLVLANGPTGFLEVHLGSEGIALIAEIVLAVVLFGDAAGIRLGDLRRDAGLPARLLLIGLPITMALGTLAAHLLLPGLSWWVCAVIGAAVAPTDAALGSAIVSDRRIPLRVRRLLNVESGLNDGIATPFVNLFIVAAVAGTALQRESNGRALLGLAGGVVAGIVIGGGGAWLMHRADLAGLATRSQRSVGVAALALLAYAGTVVLHGNGFVAAFVAGLVYGAVKARSRDDDSAEVPPDPHDSLELTHELGSLGSMIVWFLVGAVLVPTLADLTAGEAVFAVLALTIVRMGPVALSLLGAGLDRATIAVVGWFGPRGLASVVFALLALEGLGDEVGLRAVRVITATVALSVILHGVTAGPVAARQRPAD